ncbi:TetR/AcrR family transcriptional regulator [Auraticoccus monumenti]|nr:TetR/AcrR family transcriptional regulator [Auraticoccus monumenti]
MSRWEPDSAERLRAAALEIYLEQGYEQTTVAQIADRAGVTARTFFRHFADKREVLFLGSELLEQEMTAALAAAPASARPIEAVAVALDAAAEFLGSGLAHSRRRQSVIAANAELRERELIKMARLVDSLAQVLRQRGSAEPEARLVAEVGIAVLRTGFEQWVGGPDDGDLAGVLRESLARLGALVER